MKYFMGIDIGSQSSKGVIINENGGIETSCSIEHEMYSPKEGYFEQDADEIWWGEFCQVSKKLIDNSGISHNDIKAVGHSATSPCIVFLDKNNNPLRNGILYGIDTRATTEIIELTRIIGEENLMNTGGCLLTSQSVVPKILWVKKNEPEVYKKTKKLLSANGYITYKLTGKYTLNIYDAVGYTGIFDIFKKQYIKNWSNNIINIECLPSLVSPSKFIGQVNEKASLETGLKIGTFVLPGIADAAAESIGCGVQKVGDMMLMLGTSSFFILLTDKLYKTNKFYPTNFLFDNQYVLTGGTSNCGSAIVWFMNNFMNGNKSEEDYKNILDEVINNKEINEASPVIIPYFAGERTPINNSKAKAIFFGLSLSHNRGDIYKSILEAIAYTVKDNMDEIKKLHAVNNIYAIGGVTKNDILLQFISDICNCKIKIPKVYVGAPFGDAILAYKAHDNDINMNNYIKIEREIIPNIKKSNLYNKRYFIFKSLYNDTKYLLNL